MKKASVKKCHCFICGDESHLANAYPKRNSNRKGAVLIENLEQCDIVSIHFLNFFLLVYGFLDPYCYGLLIAHLQKL